ncbi:hypothetical protein ADUPG1_010406 [Aduncisulcus paluster]|uniref:Uncharacterized protein n=1 Tax=Aduncisulcus paluster TaxID=2918883 RepID=A0ABQ5JRM9_9EUKA|nr:hypothetical protein ADUPG1_010406 [Aduncisulcus paluster]
MGCCCSSAAYAGTELEGSPSPYVRGSCCYSSRQQMIYDGLLPEGILFFEKGVRVKMRIRNLVTPKRLIGAKLSISYGIAALTKTKILIMPGSSRDALRIDWRTLFDTAIISEDPKDGITIHVDFDNGGMAEYTVLLTQPRLFMEKIDEMRASFASR